MRRSILSVLGSLLLVLTGSIPAIALQEATPMPGGLADAGFPELAINVTATAFEGVPAEIEAGRYLLTVNVAEDVEFPSGAGLLRPEGITGDEFVEFIAGTSGGTEPGADATPMEDASPVSVETGGPPPFIYESLFAGAAYAEPGGTALAVVDLPPGEWVAWADNPFAPQQPVVFQVTGEMPAGLSEPVSNAWMTMSEYFIEVTEGELQVGRNVLRTENVGEQPHFILLIQGPDDMTQEQVQVALEEQMQAEMSGTPAAYSGINPDEDLIDLGGTGTQSTGTLSWNELMIPEPGRYILACFFPDMAEGAPHAYLGMFTVVEVAG